MATFLVNRKMDPELAARIDASVSGRRRHARSTVVPAGAIGALRLVGIALGVAMVVSILSARHKRSAALESSRAALIASTRPARAPLTEYQAGAVKRVERWLVEAAGPYEGDVVSPGLRPPHALADTLARPTVYIRGPLDSFVNGHAVASAAVSSFKDGLVACLLDPPTSRTEKALLHTVQGLYAGTAANVANIHRFRDAQVGLPFLLPSWVAKVEGASDAEEVLALKRDFEKVPVEEARRALGATVLLFAIDEPGEGGGRTELDGERAHQVRVLLVDLEADKLLLRLRKRVDPGAISGSARTSYANGIDSCGLALDVLAAVSPERSP